MNTCLFNNFDYKIPRSLEEPILKSSPELVKILIDARVNTHSVIMSGWRIFKQTTRSEVAGFYRKSETDL